MRLFLFFELIFTLIFTLIFASACTKHPKLETDEQKASYALGQNIGKSIKNQPMDLDLAALNAGISDAVKDDSAQLSDEEMQKAVMKMQEESMRAAVTAGVGNEKESEKFLEQNKKQTDWKETKSGLQYHVVKEGGGKVPTKAEDVVQISYTGKLPNGKIFESTKEFGHPVIYKIHDVIPGWAEALKMMKAGGEIEIALPPNLAYGIQGHGMVGPNSAVMFDISLLDVNPVPNIGGLPPPGAALPTSKKIKK